MGNRRIEGIGMSFLEEARALEPAAHIANLIGEARKTLDSVKQPTRKDEDWRLLKLAPLFSKKFGAASDAKFEDSLKIPEAASCLLRVQNGRVVLSGSDLSGLSEGVFVGSLEEAPSYVFEALEKRKSSPFENEYFDLLNRASLADVACVYIEKDTVQESPIHISYSSVGEDFSCSPRLIIISKMGSKATVVETWEGKGAYFNLPSTECVVHENATLKHIRLQHDDLASTHIARLATQIEKGSTYDSLSLSFGASLSRNDVFVSHYGSGSFSRIDGLAVVCGKQVADTHSTIDNRSPHCESHQLHKCVADDSSHTIFNGRILVQKDAQRIDAYQLNRNLLLSDKAKINTKPQLEILADDVRCSHGATVGQLDSEQLFYLESRGLEHEQARALLTYAFAAEVVSSIEIPSLKAHIETHIRNAIEKEGK